MVISDPKTNLPSKRQSGKYLYIAVYVITTCLATVMLSLNGSIPLDPLAALIAGVFAGIALVMFQLTYVKFIFKSSMRIRGKPLDNDNNEILP
ncbi:MAG: hypothetical protein RTV41_06075 [Candidatus Thorarchaeota archaeon]